MIKTTTVIVYALLLMLVTAMHVDAQESKNIPEFRSRNSFQNYLKYMIAGDRYLYRHCSKFISLVKFKIDENGHIDSISVSSNTSPYLKLLIRRMIYTTDGQWNPVMKERKPVKSDFIYLPISFYLEAECGIDESAKSLDDSISPVNSYLDYHREVSEIIKPKSRIMKPVIINIWPPCRDLADVIEYQQKNKKKP